MYSGPIIDPHHQLWDLSMGKHPWLSPEDPTVQAIPGLSMIARDYLIDDYLSAARGHNVVATVHIEALWAGDPVDETRWLETLDKSHGAALRYVVGASLGKPEAVSQIAAQAAYRRVVGVRGILSCHPDPKKSFITDSNLAYDPAWRKDVAFLETFGLNLELMMYPYQAQAVCDLAKTFSRLQIAINHCGSPIDRDPIGFQRWRDAVAVLSKQANIAIKVSNPGVYDPKWTLESVRNVAMHCIDCFGPERAMFATDAPVSQIQMTFDQVYGIFKAIADAFSPADQRALFYDTALRIYRLGGNGVDSPTSSEVRS
jgi:predicted TIM-barrel fold metal-dependent hydrolase